MAFISSAQSERPHGSSCQTQAHRTGSRSRGHESGREGANHAEREGEADKLIMKICIKSPHFFAFFGGLKFKGNLNAECQSKAMPAKLLTRTLMCFPLSYFLILPERLSPYRTGVSYLRQLDTIWLLPQGKSDCLRRSSEIQKISVYPSSRNLLPMIDLLRACCKLPAVRRDVRARGSCA